MAYVSRVLLQDERIERLPRLSRMAIFGEPVLEFLIVAGAWTVLRWVVIQPWIAPEDPRVLEYMIYIYLVGMAVFAARFVFRLARRGLEIAFTEIAVTNRRFMEKTGVFSVDFFSTDLEKIVRVAIRQSLLGRLFNYGDVTIVTIGEVEHITKDVAAPIVLQQALHARMTETGAPAGAATGASAGDATPAGPAETLADALRS